MSKHRDQPATPTPGDDLMVQALADYYRAQTYLTHTDRDMIGKAFRAAWVAARTIAEPAPGVTALPQVGGALHAKQPGAEWDVPPEDPGRSPQPRP